jgi:hypothetical protein
VPAARRCRGGWRRTHEHPLSRRAQELEQISNALPPFGVRLDNQRRTKISERTVAVSFELFLEAAGRERV